MSKDHRSISAEWWKQHLAEITADGRKDADAGVFNSPWPVDDADPQNEDENAAYRRGFDARRRELGDKFRWA